VPASPACQHSAGIPATAVVYIEQQPPLQQQQLQQQQQPVQAVPVVDRQQAAAAAALQQQALDLKQVNSELKAQNDDWHAIADEERAARARAEAALQDSCRQVGAQEAAGSPCC
jgi:ATP-dependent Clp protease ATP-binding subunit ClpA